MKSKQLQFYIDTHPWCEVEGCQEPPCPEPHHIRTRGAKGDDEPENLIRLCYVHHSEVHTIGNQRFPAKYGLESKFEAALGRQRKVGK